MTTINNNKLQEIVEYSEFLGELIKNKVVDLQSRISQGSISNRGLTDEGSKLLQLLDKYVVLLARLKKEFNIDYSMETGWEREILWELKNLDENKKLKVIQFIKDIRNEDPVISLDPGVDNG